MSQFDISITLSGTQYLERGFAGTSIDFIGWWPEINREVLHIESSVQRGWDWINSGRYKTLDINVVFFERNYWLKTAMEKYCGKRSEARLINLACAKTRSQYIYSIAYQPEDPNDQGLYKTIVHESAHKLHFFYKAEYVIKDAALSFCRLPYNPFGSNFCYKWDKVAGDLNICPYAPIILDGLRWKNGDNDKTLHCGYVRAYGTLYPEEDVATFVEMIAVEPDKTKSQSEYKADKRYPQKESLLKEYEFIP